MYYKLEISKKGRKCSICNTVIEKDKQLFVFNDFPTGVQYPIKENICIECSKKLTTPEFLLFIKSLFYSLHGLKNQQNNL